MIEKDYIPSNIYDFAAVERLEKLPFELIKQDVPALLEWMQDLHWEIASNIARYFRPYVNDIAQELLFILNTEDSVWKYSIIILLIAHSKHKLDARLVTALTRIAERPSLYDAENAIDEVANDVLKNNALF